MSDKQLRINADKTKMTSEEEFQIYMLFKEGKSVLEVQERVLRPDGDKWSESKLKKLRAKFNKGDIPSIGADEAQGAMQTLMGIDLGADLKDFDAESSMTRSFKMATRLMEKALEDAENGYDIVGENVKKIPMKTIMECVEKAGRYWTNYQKTKKESSGGTVGSIDYKEMAALFVSFNEDTGKFQYDSGKHMEEVLNKAYNDEQAALEEEVEHDS